MLIAYQDGLIVLWDVSEGRILFVGGGKDLQLKDDSKNEVDPNIPEDTEEKEITALCWASSNGSILAVGYLDGDILFWKTSTASSTRGQKNELTNSNIVKLQLSSSEKRLPIIVLHWSISDRPSNDGDGRLFIYGGDEIGSEEVLTVSYFSYQFTISLFLLAYICMLFSHFLSLMRRTLDSIKE